MVLAGKQMHVFVELSDGTLYDLDGMATSVSFSHSYSGGVEFTIEGVSNTAMLSYDVEKKRTSSEWKPR